MSVITDCMLYLCVRNNQVLSTPYYRVRFHFQNKLRTSVLSTLYPGVVYKRDMSRFVCSDSHVPPAGKFLLHRLPSGNHSVPTLYLPIHSPFIPSTPTSYLGDIFYPRSLVPAFVYVYCPKDSLPYDRPVSGRIFRTHPRYLPVRLSSRRD